MAARLVLFSHQELQQKLACIHVSPAGWTDVLSAPQGSRMSLVNSSALPGPAQC